MSNLNAQNKNQSDVKTFPQEQHSPQMSELNPFESQIDENFPQVSEKMPVGSAATVG